MDPYALIASYQNPGEAFAQSFRQSQQDSQQNMAKSAMAALVSDPSNPRALAALARVDPERAMEFQKTQMQYGGKSHDEWAKVVAHAAKAATTPEAWDATVDQFVQMGHTEAAQLKGKFSPALRTAYMAQGGLDEGSDGSEPNIAKEVAYYKSIGRDDLAQMALVNHANPMQAIRNDDGTITLARPPAAGGGAPSGPPQAAIDHLRSNPALKADFDAKYGAGAADRALGGQAASPPATFP